MEKYYITTPIYYPSDKLHIGHTYCTVCTDTMARFKRAKGFDVMFLTGTDEHGQKIERIATEKGVAPKEYVDNIVEGVKSLWKLMNISYDRYIRTTDEAHEKAVQYIFQKMYDKGDIYKGKYEGWYCTPCEAFWTESQLVDGKCPDCGRPVELTSEESYFFRLSKYQDKILDLLENNPGFLQPETRQKEMINNFLKPGLDDLSVSRTTFDWGVKVPMDESHVIYVWIDALSNYITALGYGQMPDEDFEKYWPADVHFVGKEIVRFHSIIWPAMLLSLDLPLPKQIFGHGWLLFDGDKMSKSKGNVVDPVVLAGRYGTDALRYFLMREMPFGSDGNFSNEALIRRINSDLANDLGNLLSRTVAMVIKYFGGSVCATDTKTDFDADLIKVANDAVSQAEEMMEKFQFSVALSEIWKLISRANKYIDETEPWALAKDEQNSDKLKTVMANLIESLRIISELIEPFMPDTAKEIRKQIGTTAQGWDSAKVFDANKTFTVTKGEPMFPRLDLELELLALSSLQPKKEEAKEETKEEMPEISIDDFAKVDLRTAKVIDCQKVEKADKLLLLTVDLGTEKRQVVSGIAKAYTPEQMIGKTVVLIANLKPAKIRGIESRGMILAVGDDKDLHVITPDGDVAPGLEVR